MFTVLSSDIGVVFAILFVRVRYSTFSDIQRMHAYACQLLISSTNEDFVIQPTQLIYVMHFHIALVSL